MEWIINQLRDHPELAIFLTLFAGFWLGRFKIGKFSLGTVTSVLLRYDFRNERTAGSG